MLFVGCDLILSCSWLFTVLVFACAAAFVDHLIASVPTLFRFDNPDPKPSILWIWFFVCSESEAPRNDMRCHPGFLGISTNIPGSAFCMRAYSCS